MKNYKSIICVKAAVIETHLHTGNIHTGNAAALHRHGHARRADMAVGQHPGFFFMFPVHPFRSAFQAAVQITATARFPVVRRHDLPLTHHILCTNAAGVHSQFRRQLIHRRFHRENTLCGAVPPG